jgi:murein DD-endopeptidase MepM/ murein hydrolase activator NlpD
MILKSLNNFKLLFSLIIIFIGFNFFLKGKLILDQKLKKIPENQILQQKKEVNFNEIKLESGENNEFNNIYTKKINEFAKNDLNEKIIEVKKNDTFSKILNLFFDGNKIKNLIINKLNQEYNLKNLYIGQKIYFYSNNENKITKIILPKSFSSEVILLIDEKIGKVTVLNEKTNVDVETASVQFVIYSSLYKDGIKAGVPLSILNDTIKLYSFDIDFQRDIQKETKFEVAFEVFFNPKRKTIAYGDIHYINLSIQNKNLEYFLFETNDGFTDYFNRKGKNVKKALLKTPLDGARLTSGFGTRKHPISGFNKMHKGVDFAAPKGTPIFAGGNGVIEYASSNGGYGKYIRIRHNNEYKTAYAHLSSFVKNIYKGKRVNQGDIIGYVGSTGKSTGPHLHYEVIYKNKQINPMKMKLPSGKTLDGEELEKFKQKVNDIYSKHLFTLHE